jgi:hypothetical protein
MNASAIVKNLSKEERRELLTLLQKPALNESKVPEDELHELYYMIQEMFEMEGCDFDKSIDLSLNVDIEYFCCGFKWGKKGFFFDKEDVSDFIHSAEFDPDYVKVSVASFLEQNPHVNKILATLNKQFAKVSTKVKELKKKYKTSTDSILEFYSELGYKDTHGRIDDLASIL